jgi:hypothetical protein
MTLDELKEFAASDDGKSIMASYLEESGYKSKDDIQGLVNKNGELLGKLKKANEANNSTLEVFNKYDIVDSEDLAGKLATLASAQSNESELEKVARRLEIIEKTAKEAESRAASEKALRAESEKKAQIVTALKNAHVDDASFDYLMPYFGGIAKIEEADGKINLVVDSDDGSSPFNSFVDEWSKTDKAKQFIKAPSNSGGGSGGPGAGSSGTTKTLEDIAQIADRDERLKAMAELGIPT